MAPETMATEVMEFNMDSYVNVELETENGEAEAVEEQQINALEAARVLSESADRSDAGEEEDEEDDDDSGTDYFNVETPGIRLLRAERNVGSNSSLPDVFQTSNLLFYERFKAYQDYMLGDCKTSEVWAFISEYLEKVVEPCDWQALWSTQVFDILVEVEDVDYKELKATVKLALPLQFEARGCELNEESIRGLLDATQHKVALQELQVVYDESGEFDQTALSIEHLRFFCKHIWRKWDEEDEDDEFDYFVRSLEPRLRLYYDILEDRVPTGLVAEYHALLSRCSQRFHEFSSLRNDLNSDSESELDNVSMVEGLRLYEQMETLRRKLRIIENPLIRYMLGYQGPNRQKFVQTRGPRESGVHVVHVVTASTTAGQLLSLLQDRLQPTGSDDHTEIQFHSDPVLAIGACYQGDLVIILPGHYCVSSSIFLPDSITIEGFGLTDEVVIEKKNKGDSFVESMGADVKISNIKFIEHDAIEGILCVRQGRLEMENCVLQCDTTGVIVRSSAQLAMNMCDIYGSKGAGVEVYPGSVCSLVGNGIHHCKEGILIKDFADVLDVMPRITMENNVIHNNEGYGVILVKPNNATDDEKSQSLAPQNTTGEAEPATKDVSGDFRAGDFRAAPEDCPSSKTSSTLTSDPTTTTTSSSSFSTSADCSTPEVPSGSNTTEGNNSAIRRELVATSTRKLQLVRQLSRNKEPVSTQADDGLMEQQEMFVSIKGNEFKRNGLANFGTFLY